MKFAEIMNGVYVPVGDRRREGRLGMTTGVSRVRAWTGPVAVTQVADALRQAGFENVLEGTEHVFVDLPRRGDFFSTIFAAKRQLSKVSDFRWLFDPRNCRTVHS